MTSDTISWGSVFCWKLYFPSGKYVSNIRCSAIPKERLKRTLWEF